MGGGAEQFDHREKTLCLRAQIGCRTGASKTTLAVYASRLTDI
jgi:hypothetical protein